MTTKSSLTSHAFSLFVSSKRNSGDKSHCQSSKIMTLFRSLNVLTRLLLILWPLRLVVEGYPTTTTHVTILMSAPLPNRLGSKPYRIVTNTAFMGDDSCETLLSPTHKHRVVLHGVGTMSGSSQHYTCQPSPLTRTWHDTATVAAEWLCCVCSPQTSWYHQLSQSPPVSAAFAHARRHVRRSVHQQQPQQCHTNITLQTPYTALYRVVAVPHAAVGPVPKNDTSSVTGTSGSTACNGLSSAQERYYFYCRYQWPPGFSFRVGSKDYSRNRFMAALALCTTRLGLDPDGSRERQDPRAATAADAATRYHCRGFGTVQWSRVLYHNMPVPPFGKTCDRVVCTTDHVLDKWTLYQENCW
jgi:hypothetical protein